MGKARSKKYPKKLFRGNQHVKVSYKGSNKVVIEKRLRPSLEANQHLGIEDSLNADDDLTSQSVLVDASFQDSLPSTSTPICRGKSASLRKILQVSTDTNMSDDLVVKELGSSWISFN